MFSAVSKNSNLASLQCLNNKYTRGLVFMVLSYYKNFPQSLTPDRDRNRTVLRRSEPKSRTALIDEQSNPCDLLRPQDAMIRHRGAEHSRRYELLGNTSLLSLAYLLSVDQTYFHTICLGHYFQLSFLFE
jgi:hypothetical protein